MSSFYPCTSGAQINDTQRGFGVLLDRSEGAASLQDAELEFMVHRRTLCADCDFENAKSELRSPPHPLHHSCPPCPPAHPPLTRCCRCFVLCSETDAAVYRDGNLVERLGRGLIITGKHRLLLGEAAAVRTWMREGQQAIYSPAHLVFAATTEVKGDGRIGRLSFLQKELPVGVELMTLQVLFDGSVLMRLAHSYAVGEPEGKPVDVDLSTLFVQPITSIKQRTLTGNADYKAKQRVRPPFETTSEVSDEEWERVDRMHEGMKDTTITIHPTQILGQSLFSHATPSSSLAVG
jgi:hypothetical protein